ncbi:hypothetical protein JB92DRAFT_3066634, partial [Gautieria morchelliformis]
MALPLPIPSSWATFLPSLILPASLAIPSLLGMVSSHSIHLCRPTCPPRRGAFMCSHQCDSICYFSCSPGHDSPTCLFCIQKFPILSPQLHVHISKQPGPPSCSSSRKGISQWWFRVLHVVVACPLLFPTYTLGRWF